MQLHVTIDSGLIAPDLRVTARRSIGIALERFDDRLLQVRALLRDEHGRHGAPHYRCQLEAVGNDGERLVVGADHAHPQGALAGACRVLRRRLAETASGLPSRVRSHGRRQRGKRAA